jgi:hypothetical protein
VARKSNSRSNQDDGSGTSDIPESTLPDIQSDTEQTAPDPVIEDAEIVSETVSESVDPAMPPVDAPEQTGDTTLSGHDAHPEDQGDPAPVEAASDPAEDTNPPEATSDSVIPDPTPEPTAATEHHPTAPQTAPQRGSVVPMVLGGAVAAALGFGAAWMNTPASPALPDLAPLQRELAELRAAQTTPDLSAIQAELADLRAAPAQTGFDDAPLRAALAQMQDRLDALSLPDQSDLTARLDGLEADQANFVSSLQAELAAGLAGLDNLRADLDELRDVVLVRLTQAEAAVDAAVARAGLESLIAALEIGAPYPEAVARITAAGHEVPAGLVAPASAGIRPLDELQEGFPAASRAALRVMLQNMPADSVTDRVANFLRAQTGARSTIPRDGDDPDAILSRAAAAVEAGDLAAALAEIDTLPQTGQAAIAPWADAARARLGAFDALPDLIRTLSNE